MARKRRPTIYTDEHLSSKVADVFRGQGFRVIEIKKSNKWKGREELEFLGEFYRENGIFVTNDWEFIKKVLDATLKHAGIIYVGNFGTEKEISDARIIASYIWKETYLSSFNLRNQVIYPARDGLHLMKNYKRIRYEGIIPRNSVNK